MATIWKTFAALLALWCAPALGQTVFFDDFDGDSLLPHWNQPPPGDWEYNVSNGMLNVTALLYPNHPKSSGNAATMWAGFAPQTDFRVDVWMGWQPGDPPHRLFFHVGGPFNGSPIVATVGYTNLFGFPTVNASASNQGSGTTGPVSGIQHFTITRTNSQFEFFLNGISFWSVNDAYGFPAAAVWFEFIGPYQGQFGHFHIDRVQVVPAPGTFLLVASFSLLSRRRRRDRGVAGGTVARGSAGFSRFTQSQLFCARSHPFP